MLFSINKKTRTVIFIMTALVLIGIIIARLYYKNVNAAADPRMLHARMLYEEYSQHINENNYKKVFIILDSIQKEISKTPHYRESYEMGVVLNNKAAALLTVYLNYNKLKLENLVPADFQNIGTDSLLSVAEHFTRKSITIYENWIGKYGKLNKDEIQSVIAHDFSINDPAFKGKKVNDILNKRIQEILLAQKETPRRASVSYTNLGIIKRSKGDYEGAINSYKKAIELWDKNLSAKNNLNMLLGRPLEKRGFLEKLFPPERDK